MNDKIKYGIPAYGGKLTKGTELKGTDTIGFTTKELTYYLSDCRQCKNKSIFYTGLPECKRKMMCLMTGRVLEEVDVFSHERMDKPIRIPEWCPLPDKEKQHE